jgi:DNA (cytosine-5)-methyltransferase 1
MEPTVPRKTPIHVVELFAGVGGFRLGLEGLKGEHSDSYQVVWANQWEPSTRIQHAADVYETVFRKRDASFQGRRGHQIYESLANEKKGQDGRATRADIFEVLEKEPSAIPSHQLLVGGFPCQDYSVARTLGQAAGLVGRKGVLWWAIHDILKASRPHQNRPDFALLENVDRLLKSPASNRGRDFAIMLASLAEIGFCAEWRVINAANYGFPQRRRRVFIIAYHQGTAAGKRLIAAKEAWMTGDGVFARAFPARYGEVDRRELDQDAALVSRKAGYFNPGKSIFQEAGVAWPEGKSVMIRTARADAITIPKKSRKTLRSIVGRTRRTIPDEYFVEDTEEWDRLKGAKKDLRVDKKTGHEYYYSEGGMVFPDNLEAPSRTIITGEGGRSPSRFKHVVVDPKSERLRRLLPEELERLNGFERGHTAKGAGKKISATKRAFFMGNALVVGVVRKIAEELEKEIPD